MPQEVDRRGVRCAIFSGILGAAALRPPAITREPDEGTMLDTELRTMIEGVKDGRMDRRAFIQRMIGLGLTAPMATQLLAIGGVAKTDHALNEGAAIQAAV